MAWRRSTAALATLLATACTTGGAEGEPLGPPVEPVHYVALGDSYTAAPLLGMSGCARSTQNYPALVAAALEAELDDRSCSAAETSHMFRSQLAGVPPQLDALDAGTDLVTMSIGANDEAVFSRFLGECLALAGNGRAGSPCRDAMRAGGGDALLDALDRTRGRVVEVLEEVRRRSPAADVLVVGYPQVVPSAGTCPLLPLAQGDYAYARVVNRSLNQALRSAAERAGAEYVDVWGPSEGHDVCSDEPWVAGTKAVPGGPLYFHPYAEEQQAIADLVLDALE